MTRNTNVAEQAFRKSAASLRKRSNRGGGDFVKDFNLFPRTQQEAKTGILGSDQTYRTCVDLGGLPLGAKPKGLEGNNPRVLVLASNVIRGPYAMQTQLSVALINLLQSILPCMRRSEHWLNRGHDYQIKHWQMAKQYTQNLQTSTVHRVVLYNDVHFFCASGTNERVRKQQTTSRLFNLIWLMRGQK